MSRRELTAEEKEDAKRLKKIWNSRKESLHLSQVKLAKEMGFSSQAAVSQYLNARLPLNLQAVAKFAQVLRAGVKEISPRYAKMIGNPIPSDLDNYKAPVTGVIGGVGSDYCLDWFAFSKGYMESLGASSMKLVRMPPEGKTQAQVLFVDDSPQESIADGIYLLSKGGEIVLRKVTVNQDTVTIEGGKKMTVPKDALNLITFLGRVVGRYEAV
jgi:transcriptional regulator with XRE-family HTH domain